MNILDVAIRAVLVPFRSLSRCLAENYKMYFGYSTVFPYSTSQAELKWIWAAHRCSIRISFRGVFWKFPQAPLNFYWDDPHNRPHNPPPPPPGRLREHRDEIKRTIKIYLYPYISLQKVRYSSLVCSCSLWDVFNSKIQPRLSFIFFLSSDFLGTTYLSPFHRWNVCFSCNILWGSNHFWRFRHICLHIQYYSYSTQATRRKKTH